MRIETRSFVNIIAVLLAFITLIPVLSYGAEYPDHKTLTQDLAALSRRNPNLVRVESLAKSAGGREIWIVEIGADSDRQCPAMLVVAGIEGTDLIGTEIATSWAHQLTGDYPQSRKVRKLLETTTIYIIPRLNPDAAELFFGSPQRQTNTNTTPSDDDHDGLLDEDGPEDLNGDGLITMMRIQNGQGPYTINPNEPRLLIEADPLKQEAGTWQYLPEGIDNDHDGQCNEDGPGGVNLNRNFPFEFAFFTPEVGIHPVSEVETRALAEFVCDHPNIGIIMTYGSADTLMKCPEAGSPSRGRTPLTTIDEEDVGYYRELGKLYRETLSLKDEGTTVSHPGTFSDWMYFHRGRISLAACSWNLQIAKALAEEQEADPNDKEQTKKNKKDDDKRNQDERSWLTWLDTNAPEAFISWQPYEHPDFPGDRVEIGGYRPFAQTNPPQSIAPKVVESQGQFLSTLVEKLPRIGIDKIDVKALGESVFDITVTIKNTGFLPTVLSHGRRTGEVFPTRLTVDIDDDCFLAGQRITTMSTIPGSGGTATVHCVIHAPEIRTLKLSVVSALGGQAKQTIKLSEE